MKKRLALSVASVGGALLCAILLWRLWTPLCNEACAKWVVVSMYSTILGVVALSIALAYVFMSDLWHKASIRKLAVGLAVAIVTLVAFLTLTK